MIVKYKSFDKNVTDLLRLSDDDVIKDVLSKQKLIHINYLQDSQYRSEYLTARLDDAFSMRSRVEVDSGPKRVNDSYVDLTELVRKDFECEVSAAVSRHYGILTGLTRALMEVLSDNLRIMEEGHMPDKVLLPAEKCFDGKLRLLDVTQSLVRYNVAYVLANRECVTDYLRAKETLIE